MEFYSMTKCDGTEERPCFFFELLATVRKPTKPLKIMLKIINWLRTSMLKQQFTD